MKRLLFIVFTLIPFVSSAQTSDYAYLIKNNQIMQDTTVYTGRQISLQKHNIMLALAQNYASLPDVLKYQDDSTIIVRGNNGDEINFRQQFFIKNDSVRIITDHFLANTVYGVRTEGHLYDYYLKNKNSKKKSTRNFIKIIKISFSDIEQIFKFSLKIANAS